MSEADATHKIVWRTRGGRRVLFGSRGCDRDEAEARAVLRGWPRHDGSRWRYVLDDVKASFRSAKA